MAKVKRDYDRWGTTKVKWVKKPSSKVKKVKRGK